MSSILDALRKRQEKLEAQSDPFRTPSMRLEAEKQKSGRPWLWATVFIIVAMLVGGGALLRIDRQC